MDSTLPKKKLKELLDLVDDADADVSWETLESIVSQLKDTIRGEYAEKYMDQIQQAIRKRKKVRQVANVLADVLTKLLEKKGSGKVIKMPVEKFVAEHKNLLNVLKKGTKAERLAEAADQAKELKSYTRGGYVRNTSMDPKERGLGALSKVIEDIIITKTAKKLQDDAIKNLPSKTYDGHTWYMNMSPVESRIDEWGNPPGYWLRTDLTIEAVERYSRLWEVLAQFPDGTLKLYVAPWSKAGLASIYVDDEARRDLRKAWDAWADGEFRKAWNSRPKEEKLNAVNELIVPAQKAYDDVVKDYNCFTNFTCRISTPKFANRAYNQTEIGIAQVNIAIAKNKLDALIAIRDGVERGEETNVPEGVPKPTIDWIKIKESLAVGNPLTLNGSGRLFPEQYSKPLRKILESISLGVPNVLGSSGDNTIMYSADYDLLEHVPLRKTTPGLFQKLVSSLKNVLTDIKCGEISEWNLLTGKTYNQANELAHLRQLWQNQIITHDEFMRGQKLLKPKLTRAERVVVRKELRFGLLRWTPAEILNGVKELRNKKIIRLEDAMKSKGITKLDIIAWCEDRYIEVSNIFLWTNSKGKPYAKLHDLIESIRDDIDYYITEGNYFKAVKRMYSVAKNTRQDELAKSLREILNSHLGHIYIVVSDLQLLKEFPDQISSKNKRKQLDAMRNEMAKLYYPEFERAKNVERLLPALEKVLQEETKKIMNEKALLPSRI